MFTSSLKIVDTYIEKFADGTLQTTQHLCDSDRERLSYLYTRTKTGFLQIKNADLQSKTIDDYKAIVLSDGQWERFVKAKLDSYFLETLDLTPLGTLDAGYMASGDVADEVLSADMPEPEPVAAWLGVMTPETLIRLTLGRIEKQFPGGRDVDFGDQDLRDLISAKGLVLYDNYKHLHAARRINVRRMYRYVIVVTALVMTWIVATAVFPLHRTSLISFAWSPAVIGLPLAVVAYHLMTILTRRRHRMLGDHFNATTRLSSATVSKCAILRQDTMIFACHHMFEIANTGKEDYWAQGRLKRWTEVNEKWCELIFWLNGRVTANANYALIRTKLIGMTLEGLQAEAQFESLRLIAGYLALLGLLAATGIAVAVHAVWTVSMPWEALIFMLFCGYMGWQMLRLHGLVAAFDTPEAVEEILHADSLQTMKGHKEAKLHEEVARFMKREKLKQLYAERTRLNSGVLNDVVGFEGEGGPPDA